MNVRVAVLPVGSALVLGMGLYLLNAVNARPLAVTAAAAPNVTSPTPPTPAAAAAAREGTVEPPNPSAPPPPPAQVRVVSEQHAADSQEGSGDGTVWGGNHRHHRHRDDEDGSGSSADPKLDQLMSEANHAYDRGDLDDARKMAQQILADHPDNARMLRVMVSSYCIDGDSANATAYWQKLPPGDQNQMRRRCDRYGVTFPQ